MAASQLLLLADHIKLSLLERQRAISLNLEPNSHDGEISKSLDSLREGLEKLETQASTSQETTRIRSQYSDLYSQFHGTSPPAPSVSRPNDPSLNDDFDTARQRPRHHPRTSSMKSSTSNPALNKTVRFRDNPSDAEAEAANRAALMPYTDDPEENAPDHGNMDNTQIHTYHSRVMAEQDGQLDRLGASVGRQRELSIQIGSELDEQGHMLDEVDRGVDRHQTTLDRARGRLGKFARKAKDNKSLTVIFSLIVILVFVIVILES